MPKELQDGLNDLLAYADDKPSDDTGEATEENPDLKSSSGESENDAADEAAAEGTASEEGELETSAGEEDGGEESEEEAAAVEESSEIAELKAELKQLRELLTPKTDAASTEDVAQAATSTFEQLKPEISDVNVMGDFEYDDIVQDQDVFMKWASQLVKRVQEVTQEAVYKNIPGIIQSYTDQQIEVKSRAQDFYHNNPDLTEHKAEVAKNANLLAQAEPGLSQDDFFKKVADYTRYTLKLPAKEKGGTEEKPKPGAKPALNKRSTKAGTRMGKPPELEGMDKEITEMLKQIE